MVPPCFWRLEPAKKKRGHFPESFQNPLHANAVACLGAPSAIKASQFNGPLSGPFSFLSHPKVTARFPVIHFRLVSEEAAGTVTRRWLTCLFCPLHPQKLLSQPPLIRFAERGQKQRGGGGGRGGSGLLPRPALNTAQDEEGWVGANRQSFSSEPAAEITVITPDSNA